MDNRSNYFKGIIKNISSNFIRTIVIFIVSFIGSIIYTRVLGPELYGVYTYMFWLISIITCVLGFGYDQTITKFLPQYYFNKDIPESKNLIKNIIIKQIITVSIISIILILTIPYWKVFININYSNLYLVVMLSILSVLPTIILNLLLSSVQALQKFDVYANVNIQSQLIIFILTVITLYLTKKIEYALIASLIGLIYQIYMYYRCIGNTLGLRLGDFLEVKQLKENNRIKRYLKVIYINVLSQQIVWTKSEFFFLGLYCNAKQIAIYGLAYTLINMMSLVINTIMSVLNNYFSELIAREQHELLKKIIFYVTKYFAILLIPTLFYSFIYLKYIINLMYSDKYIGTVQIFPIMFTGFIIAQIFNVAGSIPFFYEKHKFVTTIGILSGVVNILLDIILIPKNGAMGAAIANATAQIFCSIVIYFYSFKSFNLHFPAKEIIKVTLISFVAFIIINFLIKLIILKVIIGIMLVLLYYKILNLFKLFGSDDKKIVLYIRGNPINN